MLAFKDGKTTLEVVVADNQERRLRLALTYSDFIEVRLLVDNAHALPNL